MSEILTEFAFEMKLTVAQPLAAVGDTPWGDRRIARVTGGTFEGPGLRGTVHDGGGDWIINRRDGVTQLDVRLTMETHDGVLIYMTYRGLRHGPAEVMARLAAGEPVDPSELYFRTAPFFETASDSPYAWMNKACFVATGDRKPEGPIYRVFKIL